MSTPLSHALSPLIASSSRAIVGLGLYMLAALASAQPQSLCFSYATTVYEQFYCELQAEGYGRGLPRFYDFRNNDEQMQYLLLKPKARKLALRLPKPLSKTNKQKQQPIRLAAPTTTQAISTKTTLSPSQQLTATTNCHFSKDMILCGNKRHQLQYNKHNDRLDQSALTASNRMNLPDLVESLSNASDVDSYLAKAYKQYLVKMLEIGLGGVTLSYSKFYHLFHELQRRNMNFSQRFETMYGYLKKDKASLAVDTAKPVLPKLDIEQCDTLSEFWICSTAHKNYVFKLQ